MIETSDFSKRQYTDSYWLLQDIEKTIALGKSLTQIIPDFKILLLEGPLGAGKTSLVKGIAMSLGISEPITSPTFPLAQHYSSGLQTLFHLDLYRLEDHFAADELFIQEEEEASELNALLVVEWPERLSLQLPEAWRIKLRYRNDENRSAQLLPPISYTERNSITSS